MVAEMIKRKGVCDVCGVEFELSEGSFHVRMVEDNVDRAHKKWTITVLDCADDRTEEGFFQVCGITCLYEAITEVVERKTEGGRFRIIGYDGTDDNKAQVLDLTDKRGK
jgi:hypothetical protein